MHRFKVDDDVIIMAGVRVAKARERVALIEKYDCPDERHG